MSLSNKRWVVVGSAGMLGSDLMRELALRGYPARGLARATLDVTDPDACEREVAGADVVINCAAWTAVDEAETREDDAHAVNSRGAKNLARACSTRGARLVHLSTDYVFDGAAHAPYAEGADPSPASAYGRTKAAGECEVLSESPDNLVVRTAWLYGAGGPCFPRTIAHIAADRERIDVVEDQLGQPTWTRDVADLIIRLSEADAPGGIYHATSQGQASWFEFAQAVVAAAGIDPAMVHPTSSAAFARAAPRPAYSVLGHGALVRLGVDPIGPWHARWQTAACEVLETPSA